MAKVYVGKDGSGGTSKDPTTSASGLTKNLIYKGPTLGYVYDYSGAVTGNMQYVVEDGPTLGRRHSAT